MPTSLRFMPRASTRADPLSTFTEVFSNWRFRRRLSGLKLRWRTIPYTREDKVAQPSSQTKVTEVQ